MSRKQILQIGAVLVVLFIAGSVWLYLLVEEAGDAWPHTGKGLSGEIGRIEREVQRLRTEVAKIPAAQEELERVKGEYELATRVLPTENSPDHLIAAIRTKAQQVGVSPDKLVPSRTTGQSGRRGASSAFEEWRFTLDIRGTYDQISSFVNRMEEFESSDPARVGSEKRFFQVLDISITAEGNGLAILGSDGSAVSAELQGHRCTLVMNTYRFTGSEM